MKDQKNRCAAFILLLWPWNHIDDSEFHVGVMLLYCLSSFFFYHFYMQDKSHLMCWFPFCVDGMWNGLLIRGGNLPEKWQQKSKSFLFLYSNTRMPSELIKLGGLSTWLTYLCHQVTFCRCVSGRVVLYSCRKSYVSFLRVCFSRLSTSSGLRGGWAELHGCPGNGSEIS